MEDGPRADIAALMSLTPMAALSTRLVWSTVSEPVGKGTAVTWCMHKEQPQQHMIIHMIYCVMHKSITK
jgi:hypothetical protein